VKDMPVSFKNYFLLFLVLGILTSCSKDKASIHLMRFEQDLFDKQSLASSNHFANLQKKYGPFYQTFAEEMLNISEEERAVAYQPSLDKFVHFPSIQQLKFEVDSVFPDMVKFEQQLADAMGVYQKEFPQDRVPSFITFLSEFGYAHANLDTIVSIGLDMYLGASYALYPALDFPDFMVAKLRKEYMLANTLKSLAIGKYEHQLRDKRFLAMMLFEGKIRYFIKELAPEIPDTILLGYSQAQHQWAKENEGMIWAHLLETKMLFQQDPAVYMRYVNDGPFTIATGVPQESAPAIGVFAGYQIVKEFMDKNRSVSLKQLMENQQWDLILKESAYRPK
jgi:hypothetical protein